jgi:xanthine dehydrogenase YagR molybdenum-binding subunit
VDIHVSMIAALAGILLVLKLGMSRVPAVIANAVYNATGIRVRDYPIKLDKLLDRLPDVGA